MTRKFHKNHIIKREPPWQIMYGRAQLPQRPPTPWHPIGKNGSPSQESPSRNRLHTHFLYHKLHTLFQTIKFYSYTRVTVEPRHNEVGYNKIPSRGNPAGPSSPYLPVFSPWYIEKPDTTRQPSWSQGPRHKEAPLYQQITLSQAPLFYSVTS